VARLREERSIVAKAVAALVADPGAKQRFLDNARTGGAALWLVAPTRDRADQLVGLLAGAPWDLVLVADVLYEPRNVPVLLGLLPRLVDDGGEVWLADPGRQMLNPFLAGLAEAGWRCQRLGGDPATVAIHRLVRRAPARGDGHG